MQLYLNDTIVARATPPGRGGVGIVRVSGEKTKEIALAIVGRLPKPRFATFCDFKQEDGSVIDQGLALFFSSPHSFTGEDVVEFHGHGGAFVIDALLQRILQLGARLAQPGEFSQRAFLNNKIDLAQAEAIADLIEAASHQAARSAIRSLQGEFSKTIQSLVNDTIHLRMYVEAAIDFPEEEVDFLSDGHVLTRLSAIQQQLEAVLSQATQGQMLNEGIKAVIAGYPNVGKSSLLNALSGQETAIVSNIPGTTRDLVKESIVIDGLPCYFVDTAGLRTSPDVIESEGIRRAWQEIPQADLILFVIDASETPIELLDQHDLINSFLPYKQRLIIIRNKIDLLNEKPEFSHHAKLDVPIISLSVKAALGLTKLKKHIKKIAGYQSGDNVFIARRRHLNALEKAKQYLNQAHEQLVVYQAGELVAQELLEAQQALNEITGEFRSDDLLGKIFSSFCIGK